MEKKRTRKVLVVDDDAQYLEAVARILRSGGYAVVTRASVIGTSAAVASERPDMVLIDMDMPALDGDRLALLIQRKIANVPLLVLISGMDPQALSERGRACGANAVISKVVLPREFLERVASVFSH